MNIFLTIFYSIIIGIIIYFILVIFGIIIRNAVKQNMKNIIEIKYFGIRPPAVVIFTDSAIRYNNYAA
jgi:hypothetical protein